MSAKFSIGDKVYDKFSKMPGTIREVRSYPGNRFRYKVEFSSQESRMLPEDDLELIGSDSILDLFGAGKFLGIDVLKRILTYTRLKGDVTNIFYSMNNKATEFFPHQFAPVMKFIESTVGRILIADEVGLGKTIEAAYIWQELVARENSRRLLVICPSVLRDKWVKDLNQFFSIKAEIVDAATLLDYAINAENRPLQEHFALVTSLEGIRYKEKLSNGKILIEDSPRAKLDAFLDEKTANSLEQIFDLVIVDEAHYLRNSETASHKTVSKFRDNSKNLVLLSATPIQTSEENLYNLLNILDPDVFYDKFAFEKLLEKSQRFVKIANALGNGSPEREIRNLIYDLKCCETYIPDSHVDEFEDNLKDILNSAEKRVDYQKFFFKKVFYSNYFTRTRRREAFPDHAQRIPETWDFPLNEEEKNIYNLVTRALQKESEGKSIFHQFQIIARQRQMASSMAAAFAGWKNNQFGEELQEMLYEDFDYNSDELNSNESFDADKLLSKNSIAIDVKWLRKYDSKFNKLKSKILEKLEKNPKDKIIIFSYYRGTVNYLAERFTEEGIKCISLMGKQGLNKQDVVDTFKNDDSIRLLISTEVGSEGIDLQFCNTEINYDLPWNPMRLEQRIGRIDRIGQKSKDLHIINMVCNQTVEDRVLERLYDRIEIFINSIGDIEEILGKQIQDIALSLMNSELSDTDREKIALDQIDALVYKKKQMEDLEEKAPSSVAFKDYIINNVEEAESTQRYIHTSDLLFYVSDFLKNWSGSVVEDHEKYGGAKFITLSKEAQIAFAKFSREEGMDSMLNHSSDKLLCLFDASLKNKVKNKYFDTITPVHPLIKWINKENANKSLTSSGCCSVELHLSSKQLEKLGFEQGMYAFYMMELVSEGYIAKKEIKYYLTNVQTQEIIDCKKSESVMMHLFADGDFKNIADTNPGWESDLEQRYESDLQGAADALELAINAGYDDYEKFERDYIRDNEEICNNQLEYLHLTTTQRINSLQNTIDNMKIAGGREQGIKLFQSKIAMAKKNMEFQEQRIKDKMRARCSFGDVAVGLLKVV